MLTPQDCYFDYIFGNWLDDGPNAVLLISPKDIVDKEGHLHDDEMNDLDDILNANEIYYLSDSNYEFDMELYKSKQDIINKMVALGFTFDARLSAF